MDVLDLPSADFETKFEPGSAKEVQADIGAKPSSDFMPVPIDKIVVLPGLNVRVRNQAYLNRIEDIADSIEANGFYKHLPLPAQIIKQGNESVIAIVGGFTRFEAAKLARQRGFDIERVPVIIRAAGSNNLDIQAALYNDNSGAPLTPWERGLIVKRLGGGGWTEAEIAEKLTISTTYIRALLELHSYPMNLQKLAMENVIPATRIIKTVKRLGVDRAYDYLTMPKESRPKRTGPTMRTTMAAITHAINLPTGGIQFLSRWHDGDEEAVAEVAATLRKPRKPRAPSTRKRKGTKETELDL